MNQRMADDENIIEDLDTLLGQPINEQPVGIPQEQYDLYNANIDATISGDRSRMSVINQLINLYYSKLEQYYF